MSPLSSQSHSQPAATTRQLSVRRQIVLYVLAIVAIVVVGSALKLETTFGVAFGMTFVAVVRTAHLYWKRKRV